MASQTVNPTDIASFFADPAASNAITLGAQQIAAPVVSGQAITFEDLSQGGGIRIVFLVIDASPSMEPVADLLRDSFNKDFIPAVQDARADDIAVLRIGGLAFSTKITPIWQSGGNGFHALDQLPKLTKAEYDPEQGWGTALHKAILTGTATAVSYAALLRAQMGIQPEVDVITFTDGANNEQPADPAEVRTVIVGGRSTLVRHTFLYFQTDLGARNPQKIGLDLGYDGENISVFTKKPNESSESYASRFRRLMRVMSRVSASRGASATNAAAAVVEEDAV